MECPPSCPQSPEAIAQQVSPEVEQIQRIPSPRIDPGERPMDLGWRGKEGTASGIKDIR